MKKIINILESLDEQQRKAVTTNRKKVVVTGGPGTGKTIVLAARFAWLVRNGVNPQDIRVFVPRKSVIKSIRKKIAKVSGIQESKISVDTLWSFFDYMLRKHFDVAKDTIERIFWHVEPDYVLIDDKVAAIVMDEAIRKLTVNNPVVACKLNYGEPQLLTKLAPTYWLRLYSYMHNSQYRVSQLEPLEREFVERYNDKMHAWEHAKKYILIPLREVDFKVFRAYDKLKAALNYLDKEDILVFTDELVSRNEKYRKLLSSELPYILLDNYEDLSSVEVSILNKIITDENRVFVVGDDAQCISFMRGCDITAIQKFVRSFHEIHLTNNYRNGKSLTDFTKSVLQNTVYYEDFTSVKRHKDSMPMVFHGEDLEQQASFVTSKIKELVTNGYELNDIAVIYRSELARSHIEREFIIHKIPYVVNSEVRTERLIDNYVIDDVIAFLRIIGSNPSEENWKVLTRYIKTMSSKDVSEISSMNLNEICNTSKNGELVRLCKTVLACKNKSVGRSIIEFINNWYNNSIIQTIPEYDYNVFKQLILMAGNFSTPDAFAQFLNQFRTTEYSTEQAVQLTSIEEAKGMEWPVVFVIDVWDKWNCDYTSFHKSTRDDEAKYLYTAVSRAQRVLFITTRYESEILDKTKCMYTDAYAS